ncbi:CHAT domain-containing protein [Stenotrophomonas sp. S39]|uniref:CHAT domain-containing protein n=1 Tax=Stenotrophomonas sp. S39 TaxID=2767451 RepID=UPI00190D0F92|nr:CHAT domain-containing protein [Stenotrophomonas sp. S39]MBK0053780.1 CHAT domain-containing protein [Stenotrophomonas sp. S39]
MSVDQRRRAVEAVQKTIARLQTEKSREVGKAAAERKKAVDASAAAARTKSLPTKMAKLKDSQRYEASAVALEKKVADLESKLAREQVKLGDANKQLTTALQQDERRRAAMQKRERASQVAELSRVQGRLTQHDQLHRTTADTLRRLQELPERLTVLFLASNPIDQQPLRLDEEARSIHEMVRKSEHRDVVRLESRWAVQPLDVLQAINECKPGVVHFSGHGSEDDEILFQDSAGRTKQISKEAIVQTMMAASGDIQLVFFNTCFSHSQAAAIVEHVPCAIGMNTAIGDQAARVFAAQFYSAVGFGLSVAMAFNQAKAALMLEGINEARTPELFAAPGVDLSGVFLVRPEG